MAKTIKKGDFIEASYTGKVDEQIFDTTNEAQAKELGVHNPQMPCGSVKVCVGQGHLLKGLDEFVVGKEAGKEYKVELQPDKAFGKKDAKLIQMIQKSKFTSQKINPQPGMQLNIDGVIATIRTVSGGRILVDFNHPLAGRVVNYDIKIIKKISDIKEKIEAVLMMEAAMKPEAYELKIEDVKEGEKKVGDKVTIKFKKELQEVIKHIKDKLIEKLKETAGAKEVVVE